MTKTVPTRDMPTIMLAAVSILPFGGILATTLMMKGDPTDWGAGMLAIIAAFIMLLLILPAAFMVRRSSSAMVRRSVQALAWIEIIASSIAIYGIKPGWWV